jgi:hypothetical protein
MNRKWIRKLIVCGSEVEIESNENGNRSEHRIWSDLRSGSPDEKRKYMDMTITSTSSMSTKQVSIYRTPSPNLLKYIPLPSTNTMSCGLALSGPALWSMLAPVAILTGRAHFILDNIWWVIWSNHAISQWELKRFVRQSEHGYHMIQPGPGVTYQHNHTCSMHNRQGTLLCLVPQLPWLLLLHSGC